MPTNYVTEILNLAKVRTATECPTVHDWRNLERKLGYELPNDFKDLVSTLGTGHFGAGLYLRNPSASSKYIQFSVDALKNYRSNIAGFEERTGVPLYPAEDGLVVIGSIDRDHFYFRPSGRPKRVSGVVHVDLDLFEMSELDVPISQFLIDLYRGRLEQSWRDDLRTAIWRNGAVPFFTAAGRDVG